MSTTLRFEGDRELTLEQYAITASAGIAWPSRWSASLAVGAVLGGRLEEPAGGHDLGTGLVATASVSRQWQRAPWFVTGTGSFGASRVPTQADGGGAGETLVGIDGRVGATAGRTVGPVSPYLLLRAFGGPVLWQLGGMDVVGTDTTHVQLGAGVSASFGPATVVLDVSALGERSASLGLSYRR